MKLLQSLQSYNIYCLKSNTEPHPCGVAFVCYNGVMKTKRVQTSETFLVGAILSLSGGFQDAYTYCLRDHVFANAQTGNIVLMSQHFMLGEFVEGLKYLLPVFFFALGILLAEQLGARRKKLSVHWRQIILVAEIIILGVVGFVPQQYNIIANVLVSFSCAMQVQTFRKLNGYGYATTMCIGNLRSGTESLSEYLRNHERGALVKAMHYYGIIFVFAIGAGIGGLVSMQYGYRAIWISCGLLIVACILMNRKYLEP